MIAYPEDGRCVTLLGGVGEPKALDRPAALPAPAHSVRASADEQYYHGHDAADVRSAFDPAPLSLGGRCLPVFDEHLNVKGVWINAQ